MEESKSLLSLYDTVLVSILCDWIYDADVCCLDSSVCNHRLRPRFLASLSRCSIVNPYVRSDPSFSGDKEWMRLRSIKLQVLVQSVLTPALEAVLKPQLHIVDVNNAQNLEIINNRYTVDKYRITLEEIFVPLKMGIGSKIVHIQVGLHWEATVFSEIATACPTLKSISCASSGFKVDAILPLVDNCMLDSIQKCNLLYLVTRRECSQRVLCDLVRVPCMDPTAVCLGEEKYYHVTMIQPMMECSAKELEVLLPLMPNVTSLSFEGNVLLAEWAAKYCQKLKILRVWEHCPLDNALTLLKPSLEHLTFDMKSGGNQLVRKVLTTCSQLRTCQISKSYIDDDALDELISRCSHLRNFQCASTGYAAQIVQWASNLSSLRLVHNDTFALCFKDARCGSKMAAVCRISEDMLRIMVTQSTGLTKISLAELKFLTYELIDFILLTCVHLTSMTITDTRGQDCGFLKRIVECTTLKAIRLEKFQEIDASVYIDVISNKRHLTQFTMHNCKTVSGSLLLRLAEACPCLQYFSITDRVGFFDCQSFHSAITSEHVIALVTKCTQLHTLILMHCPNVTDVIVPFLLASGMLKIVCFTGCSVDESKLQKFKI